METKKSFADAIIAQELTKEAWKKLSREFKWTEELLKKYQYDIDWEALSQNSDMLWTSSILDNYSHRIDWKTLSSYADERLLTPKNIEEFVNKWDWNELSANCNLKLSFELLDKYFTKWDWECIINRWRQDDLFSLEFFERYKEYIPGEEFQSSSLWDSLVEKQMAKIEQEILG